jgi:hypothetical protein
MLTEHFALVRSHPFKSFFFNFSGSIDPLDGAAGTKDLQDGLLQEKNTSSEPKKVAFVFFYY